MDRNTTSTKSHADRFWDKYIKYLVEQRVKETELRWYVFRAERYIHAFPHKRLAEHTAADVEDYFESLGRDGGLEDWQFLQAVRAIQNLLWMASAPAVNEVVWNFWGDSAQRLASTHPTIARE
jgi:L-alanine-DL-glutamate epimerase-like enolase superfamily enzyme